MRFIGHVVTSHQLQRPTWTGFCEGRNVLSPNLVTGLAFKLEISENRHRQNAIQAFDVTDKGMSLVLSPTANG